MSAAFSELVPPTPYYSDALVTLFLGDCREVTAWLDADVLVTDPPYGIGRSVKKGSYRGAGSQSEQVGILGDSSLQLRDEVLSKWGSRPRVVFGSWRKARPDPVDHRLIWHKRGSVFGLSTGSFISQDEEIYITGEGFKQTCPPMRSVIATSEPRQGANGLAALTGHPFPKPLGLMEVLIDRCPPGIIADPFAGSGSTLIAAKQLGRKAIGVELDERYCEIAAKRLCQDVLDFGEASR